MKEFIKKYRREVVVGVVVSLITALILKFGDWIIEVVPTVGSTLFESVSNVMYTLAATHSDNMLLGILLLGGLGAMVGSMAKNIIEGLKLYKSVKEIEKRSKNLSEDEIKKLNEEVVQKPLLEEEQKPESVKDVVSKGKKIGRSTIMIVITIIFAYLFISFCITTPMSLSNEFKQDIVKITPYTEEKQIQQLESDWVCMRSKSDYDDIYEFIDEIKREHSLPN